MGRRVIRCGAVCEFFMYRVCFVSAGWALCCSVCCLGSEVTSVMMSEGLKISFPWG